MEILSLSLVYDAQNLKGHKWLCLDLNSRNLNSSSRFLSKRSCCWCRVDQAFSHSGFSPFHLQASMDLPLGPFVPDSSQSPPTKTVSQVPPLLEGLMHHAFVYSFSRLLLSTYSGIGIGDTELNET